MNIDWRDIFRALLLAEKRYIMALGLAKVAAALLTVAAAWQTAIIVAAVFMAGASLEETASNFWMLFLLLLGRNLLQIPQSRWQRRLSWQLRLFCRQRLHAFLAGGVIDPNRLGVLALETTDALEEGCTKVLPDLLGLLTILPIALAAAAGVDWFTGLLLLITLPIAPFLLYLIGHVTHQGSLRQWRKLAALSAGFQELLQGLLSLKIFRQAQAQREYMAALSHDFAAASLAVLKMAFLSSFALELITTLAIAIISVTIGFRLLAGALDFQTAFFLLLLTPEFYQPLREAGVAFHAGMNIHTALENLRPYLAPLSGAHSGESLAAALPGAPQIAAAGLSFAYGADLRPVLWDLSLAVPAGSTLCITGVSGSGKSTLLRLLAGLETPTEGRLSWLDEAGRELTAAERQGLLSYVPQEPHLFAATLAENVALFQPWPVAAIREALEAAGLGDFLKNLPQGLATRLGEGGQPLSQGQRHRLGVARALLQGRPLLLLDEPTAGLDEASEARLLQSLTAYRRQRTMVLVSHRPAVLAWADHCLTLAPVGEEGRS